MNQGGGITYSVNRPFNRGGCHGKNNSSDSSRYFSSPKNKMKFPQKLFFEQLSLQNLIQAQYFILCMYFSYSKVQSINSEIKHYSIQNFF